MTLPARGRTLRGAIDLEIFGKMAEVGVRPTIRSSVLRNDPIGRSYEYVPFAKDGVYFPVNEVF